MVGGTIPARGVHGVLPHVGSRVPQDPHALVDVATVGDAGARFLLSVPTDLPMTPLRAYASLTSAPTPEARVEQVMRELERQGAFSRAYILIGTATGGGHVNPVALELVERMAGGDIASVAIQYGTRPSILSLDKIGHASKLLELLLERIRERIRAMYPGGGGPKVLLYGESLGGWASQNAIDNIAKKVGGRDPLATAGVSRVAWVGIPGISSFNPDRLGPGAYQAVASVAELRALTLDPRATARVRAWELSHRDDPVHRVTWDLVWKRPAWLPKDGPNPPGVGADERWRPVMTLIDAVKMALLGAGSEQPGVWRDHGHDYRKELPRLLRTAFGFTNVSDAQLARITEQTRQSEVWILNEDWEGKQAK